MSLSIHERGSQLIRVAYENDPEQLHTVLDSGPVSSEDLGKAVIAVAYKSNARMLQILSQDAEVSIHEKNMQMLRALLAKGEISPQDRGLALYSSVLFRNVDMAQMLTKSGPVPPTLMREITYEATRSNEEIPAVMRCFREKIGARL